MLLAKSGHRQEQIASGVEVRSHSIVSYWLSGERVPGLANRRALRDVYGIPVEAWDQAIAPLPSATATARIEARPTPEATRGEMSIVARAMSLEGMLRGLLERVERDPKTTDLEKAGIMKSAAITLGLLGKLTGNTQEINEAKILRLPAWQRILDAIMVSLEPWPPALSAVGETLRRLGGE